MNVRRIASIAAVLCLAAVLVVPMTACSKKSETTASSSTKAADSALPSGTIKKLEVVLMSKLPTQKSADITSWVAAGSAVASAPVIAAGSYKPLVSAEHLKGAKMVVGGSNGIAVEDCELTFDEVGAKAIADATSEHLNDSLVILIDGTVGASLLITEAHQGDVLTVEGAKAETFAFRKHIVSVSATSTAK